MSQVRQEASRRSHPGQEKARGDAERPPSAEKGRQRQAVIAWPLKCRLHHLTLDFQIHHHDVFVSFCAPGCIFVKGKGEGGLQLRIQNYLRFENETKHLSFKSVKLFRKIV